MDMKPGLHSFGSYQEMLDEFHSFSEAHSFQWRKTQQQGRMVLVDPTLVPTFLKSKKNLNWSSRGRKAKGVTLNYDGIPYIIAGREFYTCHQGPDVDRVQKAKRKYREDMRNQQNPMFSIKRRSHFQVTKKKDCPATVEMLYIIKLPQFSIPSNSRWFRTQAAQKFHLDLKYSEPEKICQWELDHQYHIRLPSKYEHKNHLVTKMPSLHSLTSGIKISTNVNQMSIPTRKETSSESCDDLLNNPSVRTDAEWLLSGNELDNIFSDENKYENRDAFIMLEEKCNDWITENDKHFLRVPGSSDENLENQGFLFAYQSEWQRRLLSLYGDEVCFVDAAHRTFSEFPVATYFLRVKTNVNHVPVGFFMCENDNAETVREALTLFACWNEKWHPRNFLVDFALLQMRAVEKVFKDAGIFLSDFHRESLWSEWLSTQEQTMLGDVREEVLKAFREIGRSTSVANFDAAKKHLIQSKWWIEYLSLQSYYNSMWQPIEEKWVPAFRDESSNVLLLSRIGSEKENNWLREELSHCEDEVDVPTFVRFLIGDFLPKSYRRYVELNIKSSDGYKNYQQEVPGFLRNRTRDFVSHILKRIPNGNEFFEITQSTPDRFQVVNKTGHQENVFLGDGKNMPYCTCVDWSKRKLPCKHIMKIVLYTPGYSWECISSAYRNSPYFKLDDDLFQSCDSAPHHEDFEENNLDSGTSAEGQLDGDYIITILPKTEPPSTAKDSVIRKWRTILDSIDSLEDNEKLEHLDNHFDDILAYVQGRSITS